MDDITDTLVDRAAEKIARDKAKLDAQTNRPKNRRLTSLLSIFMFTAVASIFWTQSRVTAANQSYQGLHSNYVATRALMDNIEYVSLKAAQQDISSCNGLFIHVGTTTECVQGPI